MTNAKKRYAEKAEVVRSIWLHKQNDADLIAWLKSKPSASGYIKDLIRADMKKENPGRKE